MTPTFVFLLFVWKIPGVLATFETPDSDSVVTFRSQLSSMPPEKCKIFAVQHKRAQQLFIEYTFNWSLSRDDVVTDRDRQLTLLSRSPYYDETDALTSIKSGLNKTTVLKITRLFQISQPLKDKLLRALGEGCPYYIDDEFTLSEKLLKYNRIGYIQLYPEDDDRYFVFEAVYSVNFPRMKLDTQEFLQCAAQYDRNSTLCLLPNGMSFVDWLAFKSWMRANAITSFMGTWQVKRDQIEQQLPDLVQCLPPMYKPAEKCALWRRNPRGCDAIFNPSFGIALGRAEVVGETEFDTSEKSKIKRQLNGDVENRADLSLQCNVSSVTDAEQFLLQWQIQGYINAGFNLEIVTAMFYTRGNVFVRDFFWKSEQNDKVVNFARVFIFKDGLMKNAAHVVGVFLKAEAKRAVQVAQSTPCVSEVEHCTFDQVRFPYEDALLKRYIVHKAIGLLTNQRNITKIGIL